MDGYESQDDRSRVTRRRVLQGGSAAIGTAAITGVGRGAGEDQTLGRTVDETLSTGASEVRGVYTMPLWYWDGRTVATSRLKMQQFLNRAEEAGLNVIYAWIESDGLASLLGEPTYAESEKYDFWNPSQGWDPLGELIDGAAQRGIEVHLWYSFVRYKRSALPIPEYNPDLEVLPPGDPGWASLRKEEYEQGFTDSAHSMVRGTALCANEFDAHEWTLEALDRAFDRYPLLDGLHIEEPGYLAADRCVCQRCRQIYADMYDDDPESLLDHVHGNREEYFEDDTAVAVKSYGTDAFTESLYEWWTSRDGSGVLSYNGSWLPEFDWARGRNWVEWAEQGWVPYYAPQIYTDDVDVYRGRLETTMEGLSDSDAVVAPVTGLKWGGETTESNDAATVGEEIELVRSMDGYADTVTGGTGLFAGASLSPEMSLGLRAGPYTQSATPHWSSGDSEQSRGDATLADLREQDPFAFTPHWRYEDVPGRSTALALDRE